MNYAELSGLAQDLSPGGRYRVQQGIADGAADVNDNCAGIIRSGPWNDTAEAGDSCITSLRQGSKNEAGIDFFVGLA